MKEKAELGLVAPDATGALEVAGVLDTGAAEGVALAGCAPPVKPKLNFAGAAFVVDEGAGALDGAPLAGAADAGILGCAKADCSDELLAVGALGFVKENLSDEPAAGALACGRVAGASCTCGPRRASREGAPSAA